MDWIIVFLEIILDGICEGWFYLMQMIVPKKMKNKYFRIMLKIFVGIYSIALLICTIIGISYLFSNDDHYKAIGMYMVCIPLAISVLQIVGSIVLRIKNKE